MWDGGEITQYWVTAGSGGVTLRKYIYIYIYIYIYTIWRVLAVSNDCQTTRKKNCQLIIFLLQNLHITDGVFLSVQK